MPIAVNEIRVCLHRHGFSASRPTEVSLTVGFTESSDWPSILVGKPGLLSQRSRDVIMAWQGSSECSSMNGRRWEEVRC